MTERPLPTDLPGLIAELDRLATEADERHVRYSDDRSRSIAGAENRSFRTAQRLAEAVLRASGWRPIETAPVDEPVLLFCPERESITNKQRIELDAAHTSRGSHHAWATHWRPLPACPSEAP